MHIMQIGGYPPPWGGILVHIKRLYQYCKKNDIECSVLDTLSFRKKQYDNPNVINLSNAIKFIKLKSKVDLIHIHVSAFGYSFIILLLIRFFAKKKIILTIHSGRFTKEFTAMSKLKKILISKIINRVDGIITVNNLQKNTLIENFNHVNKIIEVIPAFIFPKANNIGIKKIYENFINKSEKNNILITSGYLFEYYGYEMILDYLEKNKQIIGTFIFYASSDKSYREKIMVRIKEMDNVIYFEDLQPDEFNWLLKNSTIYVRNTDRDGDCVAIRESAYWKTKIIASNAVARPKGTVLFTYNNYQEFSEAVDITLNKPSSGFILQQENYAEKIIELYYNIMKKNK